MHGTTEPRRWGLVLGGGGVLGAAWMAGALSAFEDVHGRDPRSADVIIGTSAGSIMAALLGCGISAADIRDRQLGEPREDGPADAAAQDARRDPDGPTAPPRPRLVPGSGRFVAGNVTRLRSFPPTTILAALAPQGRGTMAAVGRLVDRVVEPGEWAPREGVHAVALDYATGQRVVFGDPGAPPAGLNEAVMASCSIPGWYAPVEIGGRRYVDGGSWSATNIDLAMGRGLDEVFVLAPMAAFAADAPTQWQVRLERAWRERVTRRALRELNRVHRDGADVTMLAPGPEDLRVMGGNLMDARRSRKVLETSLRTSQAALSDPAPLPQGQLSRRRAG